MGVQTRTDNTVQPFKLGGLAITEDSATIKQQAAATPGTVTDTTSYPVADQTGKTEKITIDGGTEQTVTFGTATTAAHIAEDINEQITGAYASVVSGQVKITSDTRGATSSVAIGTGTTALTWGAAVAGTGAIPLKNRTLMAQIAATRKWVPLTNIAATDGSEIPAGIFTGEEISADDLEAGDVSDQFIVTNDMIFDEDLLVMQGSVGYDSVIASRHVTIRQALKEKSLTPQKTSNFTELENS
jgi:hypothetical protein